MTNFTKESVAEGIRKQGRASKQRKKRTGRGLSELG
jgi:hypothetical protein